MLIVDAQAHIWRANAPDRPWLKGRKPQREIPLEAGQLLGEMDAAGVDRCILIPPSWDIGRNDLVLDAARLHPERFAVMGRLDVTTPAEPGVLAKWLDQPGMLGLRCSFNEPPEVVVVLTEGRMAWLWGAAEKARLPIMIRVALAQAHLIDRVAERFPGLKLVMSHLLLPNGKKDEEAFRDLDQLLVMARRPNIAVKISALPCYTADTYPYRRLHPYLRRIYDAFGPRRIFWGTDFARLPCSYRQGITMYTEEIPWLTEEDKEWIMGRGVCEWLGWKLPESLSPASV